MSLFSRKPAAADVTGPAPTTEVVAPVAGTAVELAEVGDGVFSSGVMGPGAAVRPTGDLVVAPVTGTVVTVFPTGHAYGVRTADGVEVLVHVGLDTVELGGRGFSPRVAPGDAVAAGDPLGGFDPQVLADAGKDLTTLVVLTATAGASVTPLTGTVAAGQALLRLER